MKDLFRVVFDSMSAFSYEAYREEFESRAPFRFLHSAASFHKPISQSPGFRRVYDLLMHNSSAYWNNPELYPHLYGLLRRGGDENRAAFHVHALSAQLGVTPIEAAAFGKHRYFRCRWTEPHVFELEEGRPQALPQAILINEADVPTVYRPWPQLFDDVVGPDTYVGGELPFAQEAAVSQVRDAIDAIRAYCPVLHQGFIEAIGTIAITGERGMKMRRSYSAGGYYTGGIFASLMEDNVAPLVESFIHEYYHQRLWLWWQIEPPGDLPDEELTIESPVTKTMRPVQIMLHALLIYASVNDYYDNVLRTNSGSEWIAERYGILSEGTLRLVDALRAAVKDRSECLRFVNTVAECVPHTSSA